MYDTTVSGYTDDETIKNKNTNTPTFAVARCFVNTRELVARFPFFLSVFVCFSKSLTTF